MRITHYTNYEGGNWIPWKEWGNPISWKRFSRGLVVLMPFSQMAPLLVHSLRFENGQEWDAINGARDYENEQVAGRTDSDRQEALATFERIGAYEPTRPAQFDSQKLS